MREVVSRVLPVEELGSYSEGDASELESLINLWTSCTRQCKLAIPSFEEELGKQSKAVQTAIRVTLSNIMGTQLLPSRCFDTRPCSHPTDQGGFLSSQGPAGLYGCAGPKKYVLGASYSDTQQILPRGRSQEKLLPTRGLHQVLQCRS
jgi:hypothetical protein